MRRSLAQYVKGWWAALVPMAMIGGTLALAATIHFADAQRRGVIGFAQGVPEALSPLETAKVVSVLVNVGEEVTDGQVVATLDTTLVDAEIAVLQADLGRLEAGEKAELAFFDRRLAADAFVLERESLRTREEQAQLEAETKALDLEITRVKGLVAEHHALASDLATLELRRTSVAARAEQKPQMLRALTKQLTGRQHEDSDATAKTTSAKLDADVNVVRRRIELLERRRAALTLRATRRGRVSSVERQPGETSRAGEPVVHVVSTTDRVVACVPENMALGLREGDRARLWVKGQQGPPFHGRTTGLGPMVSQLGARCWPTPQAPVWGREATITLDHPIDVVAGEAFVVSIDPAPTATVSLSSAAEKLAKPADEPRAFRVPPSLAARTRFEPSGVIAFRGRHIIVSDDTGRDGIDEGSPFLFSFEAGEVSERVVPITGVPEIDDLEAIAEGDAGEVYVMASQSWSKKDKRKPARTALLRLVPDGEGFRVDGATSLAERIEAALGLPAASRALDVEGMTFHDGSLYFGVKAPLDAHGDAPILKASPRELFAVTPRTGMSLWSRVHLEVELDGRHVPGGVSELAFLRSGELLVASTPSAVEGEAGALFVIPRPSAGNVTPQLVQSFPRHKPEGLAPSARGDKVLIVFDAGPRTPSYLEIPWPPR